MSTPKRSQYLINPKFQLTFLSYSVGLALIVSVVYFLGDIYFFWKLNHLLKESGLADNHVFHEFIHEQRVQKSLIYAVSALVSLLLLSIIGLIFSHRIAGPIHRLEQHMQELANGQTKGPVQFREKDFFPELAEAFNQQQKSKD